MLKDVLKSFPALSLALVFGSVAKGSQHSNSDLDLAVQAAQPLSTAEKIDIIATLAERSGRPVDLIDLKA